MQNLRLDSEPLPTAPAVVAALGAVQAQDFGPAKWSVAQRSAGLSDADIERAFNAGEILRTHVLRPTWHFVAPADVRWLLEVTRARVHATAGFGRRRDGLDAHTLSRAHEVIGRALAGGRHLTRNELGARLEADGIEATGTRLAHILMHAELEGLICSGALKGRQHTYVLLDERVPPIRALSRDEALVELTCRYFTSHGPASVRDLQWWSSVNASEVKRGLELAGSQLEHETVDGVTYWFGASAEPSPQPRRVHLVQMFDECLVGYSQTRNVLDRAAITPELFSTINVRSGAIVLDTQLRGTWRRSLSKDGVLIETRMHGTLDASQTDALHAELSRFAEFIGQPLTLV